jgi:SanA protein
MFLSSLKKFLKVMAVAFFALLVLIGSCNLGIYLATKDNMYNDIESAPQADVVLIPGAAVSLEGELSPIFIDRVDTAINLYEANKVQKILVSGDNSTLSYNEVNPVRLYLISRGMPDQDIYLDHAGFDTYSSMYRARDIFGVSSVLIATQSFHLPRAVFIAHRLGLNADGVNADEGYIFKRNYACELLANVKAMLDLTLLRQPKYLGETIPIMGERQAL